MNNTKIKVAIGFATGRKSFKKILRCYIKNWQESGLFSRDNLEINVIVAYDVKYKNTKSNNFTRTSKDLRNLVDNFYFIGEDEVLALKKELIEKSVLNSKESENILGKGYGSLRNIILLKAIEEGHDSLLFLDDDEFPISVIKNKKNKLFWSGQHVLSSHLSNIPKCDITHGYHCGYVSPIPSLKFNEILSEKDFRLFIKAISNDIVTWDNIKAIMDDGGVTYAEEKIFNKSQIEEVKEKNKSKFISGSNLCINLTKPERTYPFYNPPGARGEDSFLATYLTDRKVHKLPIYAFHDCFDNYNHLLNGVLPTKLISIKADNKKDVDRFYCACIGWIRYKPLLMYITNNHEYDKIIKEMKEVLSQTIPKICEYFNDNRFHNILKELKIYDSKVEEHYNSYLNAKKSWELVILYFINNKNGIK